MNQRLQKQSGDRHASCLRVFRPSQSSLQFGQFLAAVLEQLSSQTGSEIFGRPLKPLDGPVQGVNQMRAVGHHPAIDRICQPGGADSLVEWYARAAITQLSMPIFANALVV
jgi:hypothetical protein